MESPAPPPRPPTPSAGPWRHGRIDANGLSLHYVEAGDPAAPLVLLLHGFPGCWYCWRHQIPALAAAGLRVVAPDLRGYGLSDKPPSVADYATAHLIADVVALADRLGSPRFDLVGHDWGGVIAFQTAMAHPRQVRRLAVLNAPHPAAYLRELRRWPPRQLPRSWYVFFFQLPCLPEALLAFGRFSLLKRLLRTDPARPGAFTGRDLAVYEAEWSRPRAMQSTINYYRAAARQSPASLARSSETIIAAPTLLIWGDRDNALVPELTEGLERWVPALRVRRLPGASHWVQQDEPGKVNEWLTRFLRDDAHGEAGAA